MRLRTRRIIIDVWCFLFTFLLVILTGFQEISTGTNFSANVNKKTDMVYAKEIEKTSDVIAEVTTDTATETAGLDITSPSAILMEAATGQVIYEKNADESLHPASITKIMTLDLIFDALEEGRITLEEEVVVSEHAASMGGSQVFLEVGETQTVDTMIKCIAVASANDASTAMAELVSGTEEAFVAKMNEKAKELGMSNTNFINCCGLDEDGHMSSARDVALMSRDLINRHPQIHDYSTIWMDTITHVTKKGETEFGLSNTNKLIKQYQWATGLKTGSTGLAKCCLSATASKDGIDLIAVIMAAPDSKHRFSDATTLLNYGFSICQIYQDDAMPLPETVSIQQGKKETLQCEFAKGFSYLFVDTYNPEDITKELTMKDVVAPVGKGDVIGELNYYYKGEKIGMVQLLSCENVEKATYADAILRMMKKGTWVS